MCPGPDVSLSVVMTRSSVRRPEAVRPVEILANSEGGHDDVDWRPGLSPETFT
jgi:hypothetical protein